MDRLARIKDRLVNVEYVTKREWWGEGTTILTDDEVLKEPLIVRKAMACEYVLCNMPIAIKPDELIVGMPTMSCCGFGRLFPEYATADEKAAAAKKGLSVKSIWGHHPPNWEKGIRLGLRGLRAQIMQKQAAEQAKEPADREKLELYRSMLIGIEAIRKLSLRYRDLAAEEAEKTADPERKKELLTISDICARIPEEPAATLQEALQSFWFYYISFDSCMERIPAARIDQYLYPYFRHDIDTGILTIDQARDLVGSWMAKCSERVQILSELWENHLGPEDNSVGGDPDDKSLFIEMENDQAYTLGTSANHWFMNVILGGQNKNGEDVTNELSYLMLETWAYLELVAPVMNVRFHKSSPAKLYEACAKILRCGSGEPAIYNDEAIIEGLVKLGIPLEEARDYSNDGCWEVVIPGKTNFNFGHIEVLQILEYVLFRGRSLVRKQQEAPDLGDPRAWDTYDELYSAFKEQVYLRLEKIVRNRMKYLFDSHEIAPDPLMSIMMDDCIDKGLDLTNGGTRYIFFVPVVTGIANCADSLAAIKKLVYEEKRITMDALLHAIETNFEGNEPLRQMLLNRVPKFGNDEPYVDDICSQLLSEIADRTKELQKEFENVYFPLAIGTFENMARFGHNCGASADGRLYQESVGSNYAPAVGMDTSGPTAVIKSITHADLLPYINGCPLDIQINSNEVAGEAGVKRIEALIRSFLDLGGIILTITGVSEELLKDAKLHPENHRGLRVRLGGLSAYFIALPEDVQDIMIKRTKHGMA